MHRRLRAGALLAALVTFGVLSPAPSLGAPGHREQLWLALSDVHLNAFEPSSRPSGYTFDADPALFESAAAEMKRAVPNPTLVLLPGDFLMHDFPAAVRRIGLQPDQAGIQTMQWIATTLERAFPHAQFAIALGNNDVPCGDYKSVDGSAYLAAVARIWAPLVDRGGASPQFAASFARSGAYTARISRSDLRLVVFDTVPVSRRYRGNCSGSESQATADRIAWLLRTLRATPPGVRNVVMLHIPPGYDVFSTEYLRGLVALPLLKPRYAGELVAALDSPRNRVAMTIAGHTHRFDFRIAGRVPIVVLGALSPIFKNNPTFYVLHVSPEGTVRDIDVHAFDETAQAWAPSRSFDRTWGTRSVDAPSLERLHANLASQPALRARWDRQARGWPSSVGGASEWGRGWRIAWCSQVLNANFARCAGIETRDEILPVLGSIVIAVVVILALALVLRAGRLPRV